MNVENRPSPAEEPEPVAPPREPVYATGPALRVPAEASSSRPGSPGWRGALGAARTRSIPVRAQPPGIRLPVFEGPLDLLLYLIRRDQLDIYDIPLGHITDQYLNMLGLLTVLDLDVAGEFLVMAATLMRLKARMLLPTWPEGEEEEEDPRTELMRQLLEYRQFKEAARRLQAKEEERRLLYARGFIPWWSRTRPPNWSRVALPAHRGAQDVLSRVGRVLLSGGTRGCDPRGEMDLVLRGCARDECSSWI
jgi:segregation and condensation protein A